MTLAEAPDHRRTLEVEPHSRSQPSAPILNPGIPLHPPIPHLPWLCGAAPNEAVAVSLTIRARPTHL